MDNMRDLWLKPFVFEADRFEEWVNGKCIRKENAFLIIEASFHQYGFVNFQIRGNVGFVVPKEFELPLLTQDTDILPDRIQYGEFLSYNPPIRTPLICNIFNNRHCIRFAYLDREVKIIEFYGNFVG